MAAVVAAIADVLAIAVTSSLPPRTSTCPSAGSGHRGGPSTSARDAAANRPQASFGMPTAAADHHAGLVVAAWPSRDVPRLLGRRLPHLLGRLRVERVGQLPCQLSGEVGARGDAKSS